MTTIISTPFTPYTDSYESESSSVIDEIYYDADTRSLYVVLVNGTICGYEDVSPEIYRAFISQEPNGNSLGAYWNLYIKGGLTGKSTEDVEYFISREDMQLEEEYGIPVEDEDDVRETPKLDKLMESAKLNEYLVAFTHDRVREDFEANYDGEVILFASSVEEALANFTIITGAARYQNVTVKSVTLFFN